MDYECSFCGKTVKEIQSCEAPNCEAMACGACLETDAWSFSPSFCGEHSIDHPMQRKEASVA